MICGAPGTSPCAPWEFQAAAVLGVLLVIVYVTFLLAVLYEQLGGFGFVRPLRSGEDVSHLLGRGTRAREAESEPEREQEAA